MKYIQRDLHRNSTYYRQVSLVLVFIRIGGTLREAGFLRRKLIEMDKVKGSEEIPTVLLLL